MRRVLKSLALSFGIDVVLVLMAIAIFEDWPSVCFFIILLWPVIWFAVIVMQIKDAQVDMLKMQTYFNIDAIRRNTDRMK